MNNSLYTPSSLPNLFGSIETDSNNSYLKNTKSNDAIDKFQFLTSHTCQYWHISQNEIYKGRLYLTKNELIFKCEMLKLELDYDKIVDVINIKSFTTKIKNALSIEEKEEEKEAIDNMNGNEYKNDNNNHNNSKNKTKSHVFLNFSVSKKIIRNMILFFKEEKKIEELMNRKKAMKANKFRRMSKSIKNLANILKNKTSTTTSDSHNINFESNINNFIEEKIKNNNNVKLIELEKQFKNYSPSHNNKLIEICKYNQSVIGNVQLCESKNKKNILLENKSNIENNNNYSQRRSMKKIKKMASAGKNECGAIKEDQEDHDLIDADCETPIDKENFNPTKEKKFKYKKNKMSGSSFFKSMNKLRSFSVNDNNLGSMILNKLMGEESSYAMKKPSRSNSETQLNIFEPIYPTTIMNSVEKTRLMRKRSTSLTLNDNIQVDVNELLAEQDAFYQVQKSSQTETNDEKNSKSENEEEESNEQLETIDENEEKEEKTSISNSLFEKTNDVVYYFKKSLNLYLEKLSDPFEMIAPFGLLSFLVVIFSGLSNLRTLYLIEDSLINLI